VNLENHMVLSGPWTGNPNDPSAPDAIPETPEEKREREAREKREADRATFADGLRQLADLIEEHPAMAVPYYGNDAPIAFMCHDRETFAATVRAFGKGKKSADSPGPATLDFIPEFPLRVIVHGFRDGIGCRRVVKGKRTVPKTVIPARPAMPEQIIPAHEEEIVEWDCGPILG
jgi:hypothetical protein